MKKIEAILRPEKINDVKDALDAIGMHGMSFVQITGRGAQRGVVHQGRGGETVVVDLLPKTKIELVVPDEAVEQVIQTIISSSRTGNIGDGKIFVVPVDRAVRVRTGEEGNQTLHS